MEKIEDAIKTGRYFIPDAGVIKTDTFSKIYPLVNNYLFNKENYEESRDGDVKEILDIKTIITNPYRRCVGGYGRNINVFFLMAEAIWIALGRKDVEFLSIFNKNMEKYSDDGKCFHAPYGYRLRHWGIQSENEFKTAGMEKSMGMDQVINAIRLLSENPNSRQVVMSIWNPEFDLGFITKDIPCNDLVMFKIRDGKLITTIANRSNDLHLGLPTNIFQFSFLTELISCCLGIELGTQTHNSQSLHIYEWNDTARIMNENFNLHPNNELYTKGAKELHIDFNFKHDTPTNRFREIECYLQTIVENILSINKGVAIDDTGFKDELIDFSKYLYFVYVLLLDYVFYKRRLKICNDKSDKNNLHSEVLDWVIGLEEEANTVFNFEKNFKWDIFELAKNFHRYRISGNEISEML
jgi:thymidylate synthase